MASLVGESSCSSPRSAPTPSSRSSWTHHVFLSFRGDDTRKGFLSHLYAALEMKGITTFKDDRVLQIGDDISEELIRAIEESMFAIVVLSPNYADSTWCLNELQKIIVECSNKEKGLSIVPVFYDVEPSHVRHQQGSFEEAFKKHEERFGAESDKIQKWRDALTKVAGCSGWESKNMDEATLVESIAEDIFKKLIPKLPSCTDNHVGIFPKMEEVYSLMGLGLKDVRFIGIWGMGGIGKTTIARAIYEAIQGDFKVYCFLSSVREECDKKGIVQIQKDLVKCVNISAGTFHNELDGRRVIQNSLCNKKVLLVIDDVNDVSQLKNLAGRQNWFGSGSRIIITTRDVHLLRMHEVHGSYYKVEGLNENEAMHLFCLKAFKQDQPKEGYSELSKQVVKYCDGLPLALEVLGSYLCERPIDVWHSGIRKIKSVPHSKILDKLKVSYDDLDLKGQNIFLDIACFFKGMNKCYVVDILEKCGSNPLIEIEDLVERSLITIGKKGVLEMHDMVEEMGKNIVIQESPNNSGKRNRLWSEKDINIVLTKDKGTEAIQTIWCPDFYEGGCTEEAFSNISNLKLLKMRFHEWSRSGMGSPWFQEESSRISINYLPSSLKDLHWPEYSWETLPFADEQCEIVEININGGKIEQLWHGNKYMEKLKNLNLSLCSKLKQFPDLSALPNLETLILNGCDSLTEVPYFIHHEKLVALNISACRSLKTFSRKLEISSLKELVLDDCFNLENVPEFGECMKDLSRLSLRNLAIRQLPTSLGCLIGLEELKLSYCLKLVCIPSTIQELKSLRILDARMCGKLNRLPSSISHLPLLSSLDLSDCCLTEKVFPLDFCHFPSLIELDLSKNHFVSVPMNIHKLPKLKHLNLDYCHKLQSLPVLPSSIKELDAACCHSLSTSEFNLLSKACSVFTSPSQDHGRVVLQMQIKGRGIPSWFVHQEDGNSVSVPLQHSFPQNERLGIALCFQLKLDDDVWIEIEGHFPTSYGFSLFHNGKEVINRNIHDHMDSGYYLYIVYMSNDDFSDEIQQVFESEIITSASLKIMSSAARWLHKQDFEDLSQSEHA